MYQYIVLPGDIPFKFTEPEEQSPAGLAETVGEGGAIPATVTVIGVLPDKHPAIADHEIVIEPLPVLTPCVCVTDEAPASAKLLPPPPPA